MRHTKLARFTNYMIRHPWRALIMTFVVTFIPIAGIVGILIAAFMTLCKGVKEGAVYTLAATLPYLISFFLTNGSGLDVIPLAVWAAIGVAVLSNLLTWVFAVMLRQQTSWSTILQIAALMGVLTVSIIHLMYPGIADWWGVQLQTYYMEAAKVGGVVKSSLPGGSDNQMEIINVTKQYATGLMIAGILFNALMQLAIARWWQGIAYQAGSLRYELHHIRLSRLAGLLFVTSLVLCYWNNSVILDMMPILYLLFGIAGLSFIHYLFGLMHSTTAWFWLAIVYLVLFFSLPSSMMIVAFIALLDIALDMRKRYRKI